MIFFTLIQSFMYTHTGWFKKKRPIISKTIYPIQKCFKQNMQDLKYSTR